MQSLNKLNNNNLWCENDQMIKWFINMVQIMWNHMWNGYMNFIKKLNDFNYFLNIFTFFNTKVTCILLVQIFSNPSQFYFIFFLLGLCSTIIHKCIMKFLSFDMVYDAAPNSLMDLTTSPKMKTMKGERARACSLALSTSRVEGRVGAPGWD